mmetsp:Transcript_3611/g.6740  ORF Transcript_3611/g.6740 Transcript_3611/m.6740 type:complete len:297 (+) Transcript_3611:1758-2648(+)
MRLVRVAAVVHSRQRPRTERRRRRVCDRRLALPVLPRLQLCELQGLQDVRGRLQVLRVPLQLDVPLRQHGAFGDGPHLPSRHVSGCLAVQRAAEPVPCDVVQRVRQRHVPATGEVPSDLQGNRHPLSAVRSAAGRQAVAAECAEAAKLGEGLRAVRVRGGTDAVRAAADVQVSSEKDGVLRGDHARPVLAVRPRQSPRRASGRAGQQEPRPAARYRDHVASDRQRGQAGGGFGLHFLCAVSVQERGHHRKLQLRPQRPARDLPHPVFLRRYVVHDPPPRPRRDLGPGIEYIRFQDG